MIYIPQLTDKISKHFTLGEALYLPSWQIFTYPESSQIFENIINTAAKMDLISEYFNGAKINIHCWLRPESYNKFIGSNAKKSKHIEGIAVDFDIKNIECDAARLLLVNKLDEWELRLENNEGKDWIHIDTGEVIKDRFFNP